MVPGRNRPYDTPVSADDSSASHAGGIRSSIVVGASIVAWSLGVFVFYLVTGRVLGPDAYGLSAALQAVIVVVAMPVMALQWSTARIVAASSAANRANALAVYRRALLRSTVTGAVLFIAASLITLAIDVTRGPVALWPLVATYLAIAFAVPFFIAMGALQGEHRYVGFALSNAATGVLRSPILLALLALGLVEDVTATILGVGLAFAIGAAWGVLLTRNDLRGHPPPPTDLWRDFVAALPASAVGLIGISILANIDVVAAKVLIGGTTAGLFGAAAVIAKGGLLLVPQALTIVLLPRVAEREARGQQTGSLLAAGVAVVIATGLLLSVLAIPLEGPIMELTFGPSFAAASVYLLPLVLATTVLGALLVLVNHHAARRDHRFAWAVGALSLLQIAALVVLGHSPAGIIAVDASVGVIGLVVHELIYFHTDESMLRGTREQLRQVRRKMTTGELD